jgi:hypothetical protein
VVAKETAALVFSEDFACNCFDMFPRIPIEFACTQNSCTPLGANEAKFSAESFPLQPETEATTYLPFVGFDFAKMRATGSRQTQTTYSALFRQQHLMGEKSS